MMRRRTAATSVERSSNGAANGSHLAVPNGNDENGAVKSSYDKTNKKSNTTSTSSFNISTVQALKVYAIVSILLLLRSYLSGITAAGNETWYPVPLIGFVRSDLALVCSLVGSLPFLLCVVGWTYTGLAALAGLAVWVPQLVMPGPIPTPPQAYRCGGIILTILALILAPFWKKPHAAIIMFAAISILMPHLPDVIKPMFSSTPVERIPYLVENVRPDIIEKVGAAALESGPLLDFVWENRNDWVKVSHGRALGYFVFGKNFNHDQNYRQRPGYTTRAGFRLSKYRETWGESDYRLGYPEKRAQVSKMFKERFGSSLANIYARVLDIDPETIVLGDMGALAKYENMGFPAVKIVFPSLFWHWFSNPHTDSYLYRMDEIDGNKCDRKEQRTFLIPLTQPPGAGLYYWHKNGTRIDVDYKVGNVYSFEVSVLHAIRPFPYFEWSHGHEASRVTIQAFGIPCGEPRKWYITH